MFLDLLQQHLATFDQMKPLAQTIDQAGRQLALAIAKGAKLLICGNGGSAADAQHFAAELIGRFELERPAWPAIALTTDTSILTALGNDYGFDTVFARQVQGLGRAGDILIAISTSGHSINVVRGVAAAKQQGMTSIGLLGRDGGVLKELVDFSIVIADPITARIQEAHLFILHVWANLIERQLAVKP